MFYFVTATVTICMYALLSGASSNRRLVSCISGTTLLKHMWELRPLMEKCGEAQVWLHVLYGVQTLTMSAKIASGLPCRWSLDSAPPKGGPVAVTSPNTEAPLPNPLSSSGKQPFKCRIYDAPPNGCFRRLAMVVQLGDDEPFTCDQTCLRRAPEWNSIKDMLSLGRVFCES